MKLSQKIFASFLSVVLLSTAGCNDILEEQPRSVLTPEYFNSVDGINAGLTASYAYNRYYYGTLGGMFLGVFGTDEFTHGDQLTNPPLNTYLNLTPDNGDLQAPWNRAYPAINTCNGIIEIGASADIPEADKKKLVAEAKFLRAHWYFILLENFGGVTLDLGSGPLKFNTKPTDRASRATSAEVYAAIIKDLEDALVDLPETRQFTDHNGRVWKATALHVLTRVYLTRGQSDDAQAGDLQKAYDYAMELLNNTAKYQVQLLPDFADVHREGNESNREVLWTIEWNNVRQYNNFQANGAPLNEDTRQNKSNFLFRMFYHSNIPGMVRDIANGRPWVRFKPTPWLLDVAFAEKVMDTRFNKSFQTVWRCNNATDANIPKWTAADVAAGRTDQKGALAVVGNPKFSAGDTAIWTVPSNMVDRAAKPEVTARGYRIFLPTEINNQNKYYPTLKKYDAVNRPAGESSTDISSTRPFIVYRLADTYLLAAEAAHLLGDNEEAARLINFVRERAGAAGQKEAIKITSDAVSLDYILDERSRELAGEQMRWFDLKRTGKLIERVTLYNAQAQAIETKHLLRPIPQPQIDASVDPTTVDGKYPQNPGYGL